MAKLYLRFEQAVLKEFPLAQGVVTLGRLPDNLVQVDNLAVSGHHARIYWDVDHYAVEDNNSLNGTFVNKRRISKAVLKDGDEILIGKHTVLFKDEGQEEAPGEQSPVVEKAMPAVPTLDSTIVLDTRKAREMVSQGAPPRPGAAAPAATAAAPGKDRIGLLSITHGKTDQPQYLLSGKLSVIGKSDMASIKLKGWFAPNVAAVISKRDDKYFIAASEKDVEVKVNDLPIAGQHELKEGDVVEVAGITASFGYRE